MIPRLRPTLGLAEFKALAHPQSIARFEAHFAQLMDQQHAIAMPYGRTGLLLALEALGLKNCGIVCPAYTCVVVAHAIVLSGNYPIFVDSEVGGFNMSLQAAEKAIAAGAKAMIATSIHGYPVDLNQLDILSKRHPDLIVIQDCAHSFAASWQGRAVQKAGTAALFGLNISKLMTSIFGGMITTDNDDFNNRLRRLRDGRLKEASRVKNWSRRAYLPAAYLALHPALFGLVHRMQRLGLIDRFTRYFDEALIDMPLDHLINMCEVEAAIGIQQCERYDAIVAHHRRLADLYNRELQTVDGITCPPLVDGATYSHYVARVAAPNEIVQAMAAQGIELGRLIDYCIPDMPAYRQYVRDDASFPRTRQLNAEVINLPMHVSTEQAMHIAARLRQTLPH